MIIARDLCVSLSSTSILSQINFHARPGAITAIAGPSGSGKSTLLRALSGEIDATGEVEINGYQLKQLRPHELAVMRGVLPQASVLAFPFTVEEVVALGLAAGPNRTPDNAASQIAAALAEVGLQGFGGRLYFELSGGEQQRVQLARVLCQIPDPVDASGPRWLFLDEPVSSLDIHHQLLIMGLARRFAQAGGGVITVMHDLNLTALHADDLALLKAGRLVALGPLASVMTDDLIETVFSCPLRVNRLPSQKLPFVLPHTALG